MNIERLKALRKMLTRLIAAQRRCDHLMDLRSGGTHVWWVRAAERRDELTVEVMEEVCRLFNLVEIGGPP